MNERLKTVPECCLSAALMVNGEDKKQTKLLIGKTALAMTVTGLTVIWEHLVVS